MVKHVVCYKFKEEEKKCLKEAADLLNGMKGRVAEVVSVEAHINELPSARAFDLILEVCVDSFEALESYQKNEYHATVVKPYMHSKFEKSVSVDYTI